MPASNGQRLLPLPDSLRLRLELQGVSLGAVQAELESAREEAHRWRRECREAQKVAREMVAEKEEQRRRKAERAARPFDQVREVRRRRSIHGQPRAEGACTCRHRSLSKTINCLYHSIGCS
jgi:hypothetical protein